MSSQFREKQLRVKYFRRISSLWVSVMAAAVIGLGGAKAQADLIPNFKNESELGMVNVQGNARTQTLNVRQDNTYTFAELHNFKLNGRYLQGSANDVETARNWGIALRYEYAFSEWVSTYAQQAQESDVFAGYNLRYHSDLGLKVFLTKTSTTTWFSEAGYRYTSEFRTRNPSDVRLHFARVYSEATHAFNTGTSGKVWVEYLPNFTTPDDYMINGEASVSSLLSDIFSIKTGYLARYRNTLVGAATTRLDSTFTTALVAKF